MTTFTPNTNFCSCGLPFFYPTSAGCHTCKEFLGKPIINKKRKKPYSGHSKYRDKHGYFQSSEGR